MSVYEQIITIFKSADSNSQYHKRGVVMLKKVFLETDYATSIDALRKCIMAYLKIDYQTENPYVTSVLQFISEVCRIMQEHQKSIDSNIDAPLILGLLNFLIEMSCAVDDTLRCRSCQFLSATCNALAVHELTSNLRDDLQCALMDATLDRLNQIRCHAVNGLAPFQSRGSHCPVADTIAELLEYDPAAPVRQACAENIALKHGLINKIINASLDINVGVRKRIYKRALTFPQHFITMVLSVAHRQTLIFNALHAGFDHAKDILRIVREGICLKWLSDSNFNYIKFLQLFRTDSNWAELHRTQEIQEALLSSLFKTRPSEEILSSLPLDTSLFVKLEDLNWETSLYWRVLITHLLKLEASWTEIFIPQIPAFRNLVDRYCNHMCVTIKNMPNDRHIYLEFQFVLIQLFKIISIFTYTDAACKQNIIELVEIILNTCYLDWETLLQIMEVLEIVMPSHIQRIEFVCALANAGLTKSKNQQAPAGILPVSDPCKNFQANSESNANIQEFNVAELKMELYSIYDHLEEDVKIQDYIKAEKIKQQLKESEFKLSEQRSRASCRIVDESEHLEQYVNMVTLNYSFVIVHWLNVVSSLLYNGEIDSMNGILSSFKSNILDDCLKHDSDNPYLQVAVKRCLAFYCLINIEIAKITIPEFCAYIIRHTQNMQEAVNEDLITIFASVAIDAIVKYGPSTIFDKTISCISTSTLDERATVYASGDTFTHLMGALMMLLDAENAKIQELIVRGLCNFLLSRTIKSHEIITVLIVKYFTVNTIVGFMEIKLQQYIGIILARLPFITEIAEEFDKAVMESIMQVLQSQNNIKFKNVDIDSMMKFLLNLCSSFAESGIIFYKLSFQILKAITTNPNNCKNVILCKMLTMMKFPNANKKYLNYLIKMIHGAKNQFKDKKILEYMVKFNTNITHILQGNEAEENKKRSSFANIDDSSIPEEKKRKL